MPQVIRYAMHTVAVVFVLCLIGIAALFGYAQYHRLLLMSVQTNSMRPGIAAGDAVIVRRTGAVAAPQVGDIVSYRSLENENLIITHRIVGFDPMSRTVTTRGDALTVSDTPFPADRIVGTAVARIPEAGRLLNILRKPAGLAAAVYLPAACIAWNEISRLGRHFDLKRSYIYGRPRFRRS